MAHLLVSGRAVGRSVLAGTTATATALRNSVTRYQTTFQGMLLGA